MKRTLFTTLTLLCVVFAWSQTDSLQEVLPKTERMITCEPSILVDIMGGATYIDAQWRNEFNLNVALGCQFRNGHAVYAGMGVQRLYRSTEAVKATGRADTRSSRTNMPVYAQYQWRMFGWHKGIEDKHTCSPYFGVKAGWNFIPDWNVNENVTLERVDDLKNNEFITPQIGFDFRCAEYLAFGIIAECEFSRRYVKDSDPVNNGAWCKPRIGVCLRF